MNRRAKWIVVGGSVLVLWARSAWAHCDTIDGPVVLDAKVALSAADVTPVLKWVLTQDEASIRDAFAHTLEVRKQSEAARELADQFFFESLVRVHRAAEGAPYTGLKPAGEVEPGIAAADEALRSETPNQLLAEIAAQVSEGVRDRFVEAVRARQDAAAHPHDVEAGRKAVAAYVQYIHYVERLYEAAGAPACAGAEASSHEH